MRFPEHSYALEAEMDKVSRNHRCASGPAIAPKRGCGASGESWGEVGVKGQCFISPVLQETEGNWRSQAGSREERRLEMLLRPGASPLPLMPPALGKDIWDINWGE